MAVSQMTNYRANHPDYYEAEKAKNCERNKNAYKNSSEFRQKMMDYHRVRLQDDECRKARNAYMREYYHKKKQEKAKKASTTGE